MRKSLMCIGIGLFPALSAHAEDPVAALRELYPHAKVMHVLANGAAMIEPGGGGETSERNRLTYIFGTEMSPGTSEAQAATTFLTQHGALFGSQFEGHGTGGGQAEARQLWVQTSKDESFTAFAYRQLIRGKEVEGSDIRIKVRRGTISRVDYAAARVAGEPTAGSESPVLNAEAAATFVRLYAGLENLAVRDTPDEVVLRGEGARPDAWCWRVRTKIGDGASEVFRTYFVDTAMPRVLFVRDDDYSCAFVPGTRFETTGTVEGQGTSMSSPFLPYKEGISTLVDHRIPDLKVTAKNGSTVIGTTYTSGAGEFSFGALTGFTSLSTEFAEVTGTGTWYFHLVAPNEFLVASASAVPGNHYDLLLDHGTISKEYQVGQVNALVAVTRARAFFANYFGTSFPLWSLPIRLNPNNATNHSAGGCGAQGLVTTGSPPVPLFFRLRFGDSWGTDQNGGMWNCASPSVAAHEFGHLALDLVELSGGGAAFREGYGDVYATMVNDDNVFAREQHKDGTPIRDDPTQDYITAACQYPNTTSSGVCDCTYPHLSCQMLSGPWVRIRVGLKDYYGNTTGLETSRSLFAAWSLITVGGSGCNSATPGTLAEVLSVTDAGAVINIVCSAFKDQNIVSASDPNDCD